MGAEQRVLGSRCHYPGGAPQARLWGPNGGPGGELGVPGLFPPPPPISMQELKLPCARVVESSCVLDVLIKLLEVVQPCLQAAKEHKEVQTPK